MDLINFLPDLKATNEPISDQALDHLLIKKEIGNKALAFPMGSKVIFNVSASAGIKVHSYNNASDHELDTEGGGNPERSIFTHWPEAAKIYDKSGLGTFT